jgi:predicted PurR-regulated permease PerM
MVRKVEISHKTVFFTVFFLASLWFVYVIRDIVLQLFVSLLLMTVLNPIVKFFSKYKVPKGLSIVITYLVIFGFTGVVFAMILPPLIEQTTNLANNLPQYIQSSGLMKYANGDIFKEIISQLGTVPSQVVKTGLSIFTNILNILTILIFTFYLLLVRDKFEENLEPLFGKEKSVYVAKLLDELENRLGGWSRGQLLLMLSISVTSYIGFIALGIPYALPLALLAGIFEIVPYIGPIIAAIPAIILGFSISPILGGASIGLAVLIQQLENYVFVPKVMEKSTGVSPIVTLLALAVGARMAGITGMVISIPIVIIIQTILQLKFKEN